MNRLRAEPGRNAQSIRGRLNEHHFGPSARRAKAAAIGLLLASVAATPALAGEQAYLVLDASGSMWQQLDGRSKVEVARDAVDTLLSGWNEDVALGLIAYGHRRRGDCEDIEILRRAEGVDREGIGRAVRGLNALGMTPITGAVRLAAEQLRATEHKATVILVSDGEETCNADPCALGKELAAQGIDFTAHVIGFDLPDGPAREQLQCLASSTGGRYFEAQDAGALNEAMRELSSLPTPPEQPTPMVDEGEAWIPGMALVPDMDVYLDANLPPAGEVPEFTPENTAQECQELCTADPNCAAWHYEPTGSYFVPYPRCHLKGFGIGLRMREEGEGWVAGVKPGARILARPAAE